MTGEPPASPASRRGNPIYAYRQSVKRNKLRRILKGKPISFTHGGATYSHLFFLTLTIDHNVMSRDEANFFITS